MTPAAPPSAHTQDAGELSHAHDTLAAAAADARAANERAPEPADVVATNVAGAVNAARVYRTGTHTMDGVQIDAPDAAERMDDHLDAADAAARAAAASKLPEASALRVAALGARGLTAMATGDASAAADALDGVVAALRRDEDAASVRSAADGPHGAAVAAALKTAAHWIALTGVRVETGTGDGDGDGRIGTYAGPGTETPRKRRRGTSDEGRSVRLEGRTVRLEGRPVRLGSRSSLVRLRRVGRRG